MIRRERAHLARSIPPMPKACAIAMVVIATMTGACQPTADQAARGATDAPIKLRVVVQPYLAHAPLLIAEAESLFARHGLDVEMVLMARATDAVPLLLTGDVDVVASSLVPGAMNAMARGDSIRIVAGRGYLDSTACTTYAVVLRKGLLREGRPTQPIRRLSTSRQVSMMYIVEKTLAVASVSLDSIEEIEVPHAAELDALGRASIDAAFSGEPWLARILEGEKGDIWLRSESALSGFDTGFVLFGPNVLTNNREGGRRFMLAYRQALTQYLEGRTPRNVAILAQFTGDTPDLVRKSCWPAMRENGRIDVASVMAYQTWALGKGYVSKLATPAQIWDPSFVVHADSILQTPLP